ncbi:endonuclease NucS, partial [Candidatus Woesearchaeota archaeon CG11_big_fil_rev_8_21_14_0_20_57_5]
MNTTDAIVKVTEALASAQTIIFSASCQIRYSGRAESYLPLGDRIILIKPDGTLLVHQPTGSNPVNYMKAGTVHDVHKDEGVMLRSSNIPAKEFMDIEILYFHFVQTASLQDSAKLQLQGTEKDMADMIMKTPEVIEEGFRPLSQEEQTKFGFIDVLGKDKDGNLVVVECKRYGADFSAVSQLARYVERIKASKGVGNVRGILASPRISDSAKAMLQERGFSWVMVVPPMYMERFSASQR